MQIALLSLFVFALNIPIVSFFGIVLCFFTLVLRELSKKKRERTSHISRKFLISYLVLFLFSISYFITISSYNLFDEDLPRTILLINISYLVGYNIKVDAKVENILNYLYIFLALIGGGTAFVFLCVSNSSTVDLIGRNAPNFWKPGEAPINGPVLDLYSMLGTGLVPFILYNNKLWFQSNSTKLIMFFSAAIGVMALLTTIILQGRKAMLSILISLTLTTLFKLSSISKKDGRNVYIFVLLFVSSLLALASGGIIEYVTGNFDVFARFKDEGLESGRYQAWADILESMPNHLFGGRAFPISESYAHNIWLDVFYDGGFIPMILLLIFHILHIQPSIEAIRSKLPESIIIIIICVLVPIFMGFQGEPVIQASTIYFSISCCLFGLIMRLSRVAEEYIVDRQLNNENE